MMRTVPQKIADYEKGIAEALAAIQTLKAIPTDDYPVGTVIRFTGSKYGPEDSDNVVLAWKADDALWRSVCLPNSWHDSWSWDHLCASTGTDYTVLYDERSWRP